MNYEGTIIRPPSEADSIILQATVGCSHNKCTFCGAYKGTLFRIKEDSVIDEDLTFAAQFCRRQKRVFLADGDALIIPQQRLIKLLGKIRRTLPWVNRISLYGNAKSIHTKSPKQLKELKNLGLDRVYMGLESGHDQTLEAIHKGYTSGKMIKEGCKIRDVGLFLSTTVLLGIGGTKYSEIHAELTGKVLTAIQPNQIAALTLMLIPDTPLYDDAISGKFHIPEADQLLFELKTMLLNIYLDKVMFMANHASNYLSINARLNRDKQKILAQIDDALAGKIHLKPESMRAL